MAEQSPRETERAMQAIVDAIRAGQVVTWQRVLTAEELEALAARVLDTNEDEPR